MKKNIEEKMIAIIFLGIMYGICFSHLKTHVSDFLNVAKATIKEGITLSNIEKARDLYEEKDEALYTQQEIWIEGYGLVQRTLGKREINNFELLKDGSGQLNMTLTKSNIDKEAVAQVEKLNRYCEGKEISFLFVQLPYKNYDNIKELQNYGDDSTEEDFDWFVEKVKTKGISCLDLREDEKTKQYYRTDHHWTVEASFYAAKDIADRMTGLIGQVIDMEVYEGEKYETEIYKEAFLGSYGIKVGKYYAGEDDFSLLIPNFPTRLKYEHRIDGELILAKSGDFEESFIDKELLENKGYHNKYNALLHGGYVENIIYNELAKNETKVLVIGHSYGRPLVQYLGLGVQELRYLDPQDGRYNENILEYIEKYEPDIVIDMYNQKLNLG